jgi:hypothetical protein
MTEGTVKLPYVKGLSENLRKIYNSFNIRAAFRCGSRVKEIGYKTKSKLEGRRKDVVYQIPCLCGAVYVGQTERAVKTRHQEHESDLRLARTDLENNQDLSAERRMRSSRLVQHCIRDCGQNPDWEGVKVIARDSGWTTRRLRETFLTRKIQAEGKRVINDTDLTLDESWNQTLDKFWSKDFTTRGNPS